jgi:hypothetical protein
MTYPVLRPRRHQTRIVGDPKNKKIKKAKRKKRKKKEMRGTRYFTGPRV